MVDLRKAAAIVGIYEHPARFAPDKSELLVQAESVIGALADAGLEKKDVDGLFSSSMSVRMANVSLADYMDLYPKHLDDTSVGGASFEFHLGPCRQRHRRRTHRRCRHHLFHPASLRGHLHRHRRRCSIGSATSASRARQL